MLFHMNEVCRAFVIIHFNEKSKIIKPKISRT